MATSSIDSASTGPIRPRTRGGWRLWTNSSLWVGEPLSREFVHDRGDVDRSVVAKGPPRPEQPPDRQVSPDERRAGRREPLIPESSLLSCCRAPQLCGIAATISSRSVGATNSSGGGSPHEKRNSLPVHSLGR